MKKAVCFLFTLLLVLVGRAQEMETLTLVDMDRDGIADTVRINFEQGLIECCLSTKKFKPIRSKTTDSLLEDYRFDIYLTADSISFTLTFLYKRGSEEFTFECNPRRKNVFLSRYALESLEYFYNDEIRDDYLYVTYYPVEGKVKHVRQRSKGNINDEDFDPDDYVETITFGETEKMYILLSDFHVEEFQNLSSVIWTLK